jgi:hypothetical protein
MRRWVKTLAYAAITTLIMGCGSSTAVSLGLIGPEDPDYPVQNSDPRDVIALTVVMPPDLSVKLTSIYIAGTTGGTLASGTACVKARGGGEPALKHVEEPVELARDGEIYRGEVPVDKYLPGRCQWKDLALRYQLTASDGLPIRVAEFRNPRSASSADSSPKRFDLWCTRDWTPEDDARTERCVSLVHIPRVNEAFLESIPADERGSDGPLELTANERVLHIEFHDLDALPAARAPGARR